MLRKVTCLRIVSLPEAVLYRRLDLVYEMLSGSVQSEDGAHNSRPGQPITGRRQGPSQMAPGCNAPIAARLGFSTVWILRRDRESPNAF